MSKEKNIFDKYIEVIGESVPLMMIPSEWDDKQIEKALQKCIDTKKPFDIKDYDKTHTAKRKY